MFRDVTIGQYYSADSLVHRLDPRVKIRFTIAYILLLLPDRNLIQFCSLTLLLVVAVLLSNIPLGYIGKGTGAIGVFLIVCSLLNAFTTPGSTMFMAGPLNVTREGLIKSGFVLWRMILIIMVSSLMMYTTTPTKLTEGMEKCFHLNGDIAMGITIALRFIPLLFGQLHTIMKAAEARGAEFSGVGIKKKIQNLRIVVIPLFQNAIKSAENLGNAMDARCFSGGKRNAGLKKLKYNKADAVAYICIFIMVMVEIFLIIRY